MSCKFSPDIKLSTLVFGADSESDVFTEENPRCQSCEQHELWSRRDCAAALRMAGATRGGTNENENLNYKHYNLQDSSRHFADFVHEFEQVYWFSCIFSCHCVNDSWPFRQLRLSRSDEII